MTSFVAEKYEAAMAKYGETSGSSIPCRMVEDASRSVSPCLALAYIHNILVVVLKSSGRAIGVALNLSCFQPCLLEGTMFGMTLQTLQPWSLLPEAVHGSRRNAPKWDPMNTRSEHKVAPSWVNMNTRYGNGVALDSSVALLRG